MMKNCIIFLKHILWYVFTEKEVLSDQYANTLSQSNFKSIKGKALFVAGRVLTFPTIWSMVKLSHSSKEILPVLWVFILEKCLMRATNRSPLVLNMSSVFGASPNLLGASAAHSIISSNSVGPTSP